MGRWYFSYTPEESWGHMIHLDNFNVLKNYVVMLCGILKDQECFARFSSSTALFGTWWCFRWSCYPPILAPMLWSWAHSWSTVVKATEMQELFVTAILLYVSKNAHLRSACLSPGQTILKQSASISYYHVRDFPLLLSFQHFLSNSVHLVCSFETILSPVLSR